MPSTPVQSFLKPFITSYLAPILLFLSLSLGILAMNITPHEEEPQIVVPMADVIVDVPGASAREVEKLVATRLEKLLWQLNGVEYVYSSSQRDRAIVTVRFFVGQNLEESLVRLHNQIFMHKDQVPSIVSDWIIKPVSIDDVPILNITLFSDKYSDYELRRFGVELLARLSEVENVSRTGVYGGRRGQVLVELDPQAMAGRGISPARIYQAIDNADYSLTLGHFPQGNRLFQVLGDAWLTHEDQVADLVIENIDGLPVYLKDVARVTYGPAEPEYYTRLGLSESYQKSASMQHLPLSMPSVTLALAKKQGASAVAVADSILDKLDELAEVFLPSGVYTEVTRNYGLTAHEKVSDLFRSLFFAVTTVVLVLSLTLGWRPALVVGLAIPVSFSLALFGSYLLGYTINRVTLFALILSLGLVVDDPITNVDNVKRHMAMGGKDPANAVLSGVSEVLVPVVMSTLAIIACFLPLFFITGMMGPYMAPMAANVPLTVTFSTLCAVTIVPWLCHRFLKSTPVSSTVSEHQGVPNWLSHGYRKIMLPFLNSPWLRRALFALVAVMLLTAVSLAIFRFVPLKMLPFDNKDEFQVVINMPEGSTLEQTDAVLRDFEAYFSYIPEITTFTSYAGMSSPMDFNAMVRQYYARERANQGDIRINLLPRKERTTDSHALILSMRRDLENIALRYGAVMELVEVPPGPPVLATIVAEIYAEPHKTYPEMISAAEHVKKIMMEKEFIRDVDYSAQYPHKRYDFVLDRTKAALHGLDAREIMQNMNIFIKGATPAQLHSANNREALDIRIVLPLEKRAGITNLEQLQMVSQTGHLIPIGELGHFEKVAADEPVLHKNLRRVVYVTAEMAGQPPGEAILDMKSSLKANPLPQGFIVDWQGEGEWKITIDVFRDLGLAFAFALGAIYLLLIIQTGSLGLPLLIMSAIPLTLMGIMPGFFLLNLIVGKEVDGFADPVFFTATAMIGMIALGGIVIRNSLVLIDFISSALKKGLDLTEAILQSGAVRLRPIVLTALTTAIGVWPITRDPVFSGLAWALIFGLIASTMFTLILIPISYYLFFRPKTNHP
ncbi:efflux RND transporter permease subunit [Desulfonatronovibrio magnus]|uniref:efflux RND transporter permease subunit n=1 Tax=Desulfonatronovibrio magnus TaxID=698827 RepID=UPI0005EACF52|nr:efflux RND transporter permease subunit [Desulfonatronovibrio magnus]